MENTIQRSDIRTMRNDIILSRANGIPPAGELKNNISVPQKPVFRAQPKPAEPMQKFALPKIEEKIITTPIQPLIKSDQQNNQATKVTFSSFEPQETTIPKNPMFAEKEFSKDIPPTAKNNLINSGKTEEKNRKKFMEEVEEWAKNNK